MADYDLILVGGGLQNALVALGALAHNQKRSIALIEREAELGGNHTWCLHAHDIPEHARHFTAPLVGHAWAGYDVRFPGYTRTVTGGYSAVTSAHFAQYVRGRLQAAPCVTLRLGTSARTLQADGVVLEDGEPLRGRLVIDARGPERHTAPDGCGFQKFVGLELEFDAPHQVERPIVMDATVEQLDGYRFFYTLPLSPTRLLVEDTRFSLQPALDRPALRDHVHAYAARFGRIAAQVREESGVLPMPYRGEFAPRLSSPLIAGYRGGFFHPATGYSFPAALRLAQHIATRPAAAVFDRALSKLVQHHAAQVRYTQWLNWLLFHGFDPPDMWNVFERFYRLPDALIHRFYALNLSATDRARIMLGSPPRGFKLGNALRHGHAQLERAR